MISDELTTLMQTAQQSAINFEKHLQESHNADGHDVADVDWPAVFAGETDDNRIGLVPLEKYIDDKDKLADVLLPAAIKHHKFVRCVLTFTAWAVRNPKDLSIPASEHPEKAELVFIAGFENGCSIMTWASVDRSTELPKLVDWEPISEADTMLGRFSEPIQHVLKEMADA